MLLLLVHGIQCFHPGLRACSVRTFLCRCSRITFESLWKYTRDFSGKNDRTILNQVTQTAQWRGHQAADSRVSWSMLNETMKSPLRSRDTKHLSILETGQKLEACSHALLGKSSWNGKLLQELFIYECRGVSMTTAVMWCNKKTWLADFCWRGVCQ